jgi:hypothetical protein
MVAKAVVVAGAAALRLHVEVLPNDEAMLRFYSLDCWRQSKI